MDDPIRGKQLVRSEFSSGSSETATRLDLTISLFTDFGGLIGSMDTCACQTHDVGGVRENFLGVEKN